MLDLAEQNGPRTETVLVDTGMDAGVHLSTEKWRAWRQEHQHRPATIRAYSTPADGLVVREECWADEIVLGPLVIRGVTISEATPSEQEGTDYEYAGSLGLKALRRLDLVVDGRTGIAYARPRLDSPPPVQHNRLGAIFAPPDQDGDDLVARVAANSPAAQAGILDGDVLLQIDDLDVTQWKTEQGILPLGRFWEKPAGTRYRLIIRRNDRAIVLTVELETILGPRVMESDQTEHQAGEVEWFPSIDRSMASAE